MTYADLSPELQLLIDITPGARQTFDAMAAAGCEGFVSIEGDRLVFNYNGLYVVDNPRKHVVFSNLENSP